MALGFKTIAWARSALRRPNTLRSLAIVAAIYGCGAVPSQPQLCNVQVIPEHGVQLTTPVNGVQYDSDGFFSNGQPCYNPSVCPNTVQTPGTIWYKVPDNCDATVTIDGSGNLVGSSCCNFCAATALAAMGKVGSPQFTTNSPLFCHDAFPFNPFCNAALPQPCR